MHFRLLGFIRPLFRILVNFTLFGLIFIFNYFRYLGGENFGAWTFILRSREICHVISTSLSRLRHVSQPIYVIEPTFSAHSGIFVILIIRVAFFLNRSGIFDVTMFLSRQLGFWLSSSSFWQPLVSFWGFLHFVFCFTDW